MYYDGSNTMVKIENLSAINGMFLIFIAFVSVTSISFSYVNVYTGQKAHIFANHCKHRYAIYESIFS